jgi:hypothetical protein
LASDAEMRRLTSTLRAEGCQVFSLTYQNPSMAVGHTPYVHNADDLRRFITTVHDYCARFRGEFGGQFMGLTQLRAHMAAQRASSGDPRYCLPDCTAEETYLSLRKHSEYDNQTC